MTVIAHYITNIARVRNCLKVIICNFLLFRIKVMVLVFIWGLVSYVVNHRANLETSLGVGHGVNFSFIFCLNVLRGLKTHTLCQNSRGAPLTTTRLHIKWLGGPPGQD